jgi:threonine/homoserine/homoserine lactone efflux protein
MHVTFESWAAFTAASAVLLIIPGPTVLLVVSYALGQGWRTALPMAVGVALGDFTAMTLSMLGLGALLATSATLFTALKWVGAAYLVYLGVRLLRTGATQLRLSATSHKSPRRLFVEGAVSNLSNPKIVAFAALTFLITGPIGYYAGALSGWLRSRSRTLTWINRSSGAVLICLGVGLAFDQRR